MQEQVYDYIYQREMEHWWYRVRRQLVKRLVARYSQGTAVRILDIGCGTGALLRELSAYGEASGIDVSEKAVQYCKERGLTRVSLGDAAKLPFPDASFDIVVILDVLEHIEDDAAGCNEIKRVLKPGGHAIIAVPAFMFLWGVTDVLSHHYRRYTRPRLLRCVRASGLRVEYATYFNTFLFPAIAFVRLAVRVLSIPMRSEQNLESPFVNNILFHIFSLEARLIPYIRFPFGVSVLALVRKES